MFGIRSETATEEQVVGAIHPDDRAGWEAALREAMDPGKRAEYRMEYRVRTSDGTERWLASVGRAFFVDERPVRVLGAVRDITAQKIAETERELFLGALGHDLRNPLTVISVSAALLLRRQDPATEKIVARIAASGARMKAMIRDLLEFARTRAGGLRLRRTQVDLGALCRELLDQLELAHPDRRFALECAGRVEGEWDRDRLAQVIDNLVGNAIAHGYADTAVSIAIRVHADGVVLEVANQGAPIPESVQPHLFDAFRRGPATGQGLGLGLYIVREVVAAHGGTVTVHSDERETRFSVNLACLSTGAMLDGRAAAP
jgi:PAS domain S-box-containing protein